MDINLPNITLHDKLTHGKYQLISNTKWKYLYEYIFETHETKLCFEKNIINYFRIANPFSVDDLYNSNYGSYTPLYINTYGIDRAIQSALKCKEDGKQFYAVILNIYVFNILEATQEDFNTINEVKLSIKDIYDGNTPKYGLNYEDPAVNALVIFSSLYSNINNNNKSLMGHTNMILFDLTTNTVERFESFGYKGDYLQLVDFDSKMEVALKKNKFTYLRPIDYAEEYGLQKFLMDAKDPYNELGTCTCTIWSVYYLDCRLLNSTVDRSVLIKRLNSHFLRMYGKESEKYMYMTIYNYWNLLKTYIEFRQKGLPIKDSINRLKTDKYNFYYKKGTTTDTIQKSIWSYFKV